MKPTIGVLAVQGSFAEHIDSLQKLDVNCLEIRQKSDLTDHQLQGIILPGGESTVMGKLLQELDLFADLKHRIENGLPVLGTCAGLILLAKAIANDPNVYLGTMDIVAKRNAYGRQLGSFSAQGSFAEMGEIPMTFIRAPFIESASKYVEILAKIDGHIVAAKQDNMVVTSFHPELSADLSVHRYFLNLCE
ncbi:pyridoxal 5'-phosphate synthase glutaminase subunit PdxT [Acetobacterium bakii]|uniref:Pyridoxal 5'-phosphate synthase subunit PdxT n=1 Tax=Acetobacterium bakii TaxID=52689 RepID=A0A0L6TZS1_9FIRM|nr:pyridoxal 5'-phosphate synthase glutaminase subunit PdxT [Acetobacterium bakii]KNZ41761.1 glutamine amidotransferase [Acetobacterium bakii]